MPSPKRPVPARIDFPRNLLEFQRTFHDETACADYLERAKWPDGFVCPGCGLKEEPYRFKNKPFVLRCRSCDEETSLTAGTIMHKTRTPICTWFWSAYLMTTQTPGMSALGLQRQLGIPRYETAFQILHKLRSAMIRPERDKIGGSYPIEVDEAFVGGRTRGGSGRF